MLVEYRAFPCFALFFAKLHLLACLTTSTSALPQRLRWKHEQVPLLAENGLSSAQGRRLLYTMPFVLYTASVGIMTAVLGRGKALTGACDPPLVV